MIYSIFCILEGKTIGTIHGNFADDNAAIEKARWYQQSSAADTIRVHRDAPLYPLGEMIAELKAEPSTTQHTPGPWEDISYSEHAGFLIKTNGRWNPDMPRDKALMIAAPDMLEALALCVDCLSELARLDDGTPSISALDMARTAIAKATA